MDSLAWLWALRMRRDVRPRVYPLSAEALEPLASVGEVPDVVLVGPALPETIARIALYPDGTGSESLDPSITIQGVYPRAQRRVRADEVGRAVHVLRFYGGGHDGPAWRCSCGAVGTEDSREEATWSA